MLKILLVALAIVMLLLSGGPAMADHPGNGDGDLKPGWGLGTTGHEGPPGGPANCPCENINPPGPPGPPSGDPIPNG